MIAWERSRTESTYGIIWGDAQASGNLEFNMPKHLSCCVPLSTNNFRNSTGMMFYRIPKKGSIRPEYIRFLRTDNLKLESDSIAHAFALLTLKRKNNQSKYKQYPQNIMD